MDTSALEKLKFPIGKFNFPKTISEQDLSQFILNLETFPKNVFQSVKHCSIDDFKKTYRPYGWNVAQIIHHCVDSHTIAYTRLKFTLLEDNYEAKIYDETQWVNTSENSIFNVMSAIEFLKHLHFRYVEILKSLNNIQWQRTFYNPYSKKIITIAELASLYSWHCLHHLQHINIALGKA